MSDNNKELDIALSSWYLSPTRAANILGASLVSSLGRNQPVGLQRAAYFYQLSEEIGRWLKAHRIPSLGELLQKSNLKEGEYFTYYAAFYYRRQKLDLAPGRFMHCDLKELGLPCKMEVSFSDENMTCITARTQLSGRQRHLLFGQITKISDDKIVAVPVMIATPAPDMLDASYLGQRWGTRLEVFIDAIDSFSLVREIPPPQDSDLCVLKTIPESQIKKAIAEILNEQSVPKDWAGERSDLFTTQVVVDGQRISTAIAFKGPSKFKPMTLAELGKNGDQIDRLFTEPVDLVMLQHCHSITTPVRGMMRAYATRIYNLKLFCILDGKETLRLLKAYKKCGLQ